MENTEKFQRKLEGYGLHCSAFLDLFTLWGRMSPEERGQIMDADKTIKTHKNKENKK